MDADTLITIVSILIFILIFALSIGTAIFWLWMLIDLIKRETTDKALWAVLMLFAGIIGSIIYFFSVYKKEGPAK